MTSRSGTVLRPIMQDYRRASLIRNRAYRREQQIDRGREEYEVLEKELSNRRGNRRKPAGVGSATPGVLTKNDSVIRNVALDIAAPRAEATGTNAPAMSAAAVVNSIVPMRSLAPWMPNATFIQLIIGL